MILIHQPPTSHTDDMQSQDRALHYSASHCIAWQKKQELLKKCHTEAFQSRQSMKATPTFSSSIVRIYVEVVDVHYINIFVVHEVMFVSVTLQQLHPDKTSSFLLTYLFASIGIQVHCISIVIKQLPTLAVRIYLLFKAVLCP